MKAKKKPLEVLTLEELGVEPYVLEEIINLVPPPPRKGGKRVSDVSELLSLLRSEKQINL
jgi:electron transfer flavoprotein beta subunit